jgi:hypothetical protein
MGINWKHIAKAYFRSHRLDADMRRDFHYWRYVQRMQTEDGKPPSFWVGAPEAWWFHWKLCPGGNPTDGHVRWPDAAPRFARDCVRCFRNYIRRAKKEGA